MEFSDEKYFTLDEYDFEPGLENDVGEDDDVWKDEDLLELNNVPIDLWSASSLDKPPGDPPEWVDRLAGA